MRRRIRATHTFSLFFLLLVKFFSALLIQLGFLGVVMFCVVLCDFLKAVKAEFPSWRLFRFFASVAQVQAIQQRIFRLACHASIQAFAATVLRLSSVECVYVFSVISTFAWPKISATVLASEPALMHRLANVCRNAWKVCGEMPKDFSRRPYFCRYDLGSSGNLLSPLEI